MAVDPLAAGATAAASLIRVPGEGSNTLSYTIAAGATLTIEAISVDADATAAAGGTVSARYVDASGLTVADSTSASQLQGGSVAEITFAPFLPDTSQLGFPASTSELQTGLVLTELTGSSVVQIVATDPAVILTEARIWAAGAVGQDIVQAVALQPLYLMQNDGNLINPGDFGGPAG